MSDSSGYGKEMGRKAAGGAVGAVVRFVIGALLVALLGSNGAWLYDERNDVESGSPPAVEQSDEQDD